MSNQSRLLHDAISLYADIDSAHQSIISASLTAAQMANSPEAIVWYKSVAAIESSMESARRAVSTLVEQMPGRAGNEGGSGPQVQPDDAPLVHATAPASGLSEALRLEPTSVMCLVDDDGSFSYVSPSIGELLGLKSFVLLGKPVSTIASMETQPAVASAFADAAVSPGVACRCECQAITHRAGRFCWVELTVVALQGRAEPSSYFCVLRDIDERKKFEHEVKYLSAMTSASRDLIAFVDRRYAFRYVNDTFADYWQKDSAEIVASNVADLYGLEVFFRQLRPIFDRVFTGEFESVVQEIDLPACGKRFFQVNYLPAKMNSGLIEGVVLLLHDIDVQVRRERDLVNSKASLEATNESLEQFVRIASHDLKEPLNTITNFAGLLEEECGGSLSKSGLEYLGYVQSGAGRLQLLMRDLLSFSRLESIEAQVTEIALELLLAEVRESMQDAIDRGKARIVHGPLPVVLGYRPLLTLLLQNLLGNAIKFRRENTIPVVTVTARPSADAQSWLIAVSDNGVGIPERHREDIFKIFRRLHTSNEFEGTGLGLAICRKVAELHNGSIRVESNDGNGSRFLLTLPRHPEAFKPIESVGTEPARQEQVASYEQSNDSRRERA